MTNLSSQNTGFFALWVQEALGSTTKAARLMLANVASGRLDLDRLGHAGIGHSDIPAQFDSTTARVFAKAREPALRTWQDLRNSGIEVVTAWDDRYPQKLAAALAADRPLVLFCKGNLELLDTPGVGFCGSRNASPLGIAVAGDCAAQVAVSGFNVVSGNAKGVDVAAHAAALAAMGTTTIVMAEGILRFKLKPEVLGPMDLNRTLIVSQFHPKSMWSVGYAMTRNLTICGLADAMVVVEAGATGGTFHAGESCLRIGRPLFAADYQHNGDTNSGNAILIRRGAIPLRKDPSTGRANLTEIRSLLRTRTTHYEHREPAQRLLFPAHVSDRPSKNS
jgi:DNA processing protein